MRSRSSASTVRAPSVGGCASAACPCGPSRRRRGRCASRTPSSSARGASRSPGTTDTRPASSRGHYSGSGGPSTPRATADANGANPADAGPKRLYPGPMTCGSCGANAPEEARFCPSCGHTLVTRPDERRIATVLFADLVGFTTFSESADPENVKNLVDRCFERLVADVTAFGGQVDKIVGDAVVALFGAPVAHEDDAERA